LQVAAVVVMNVVRAVEQAGFVQLSRQLAAVDHLNLH
jgi:hypothetical protein